MKKLILISAVVYSLLAIAGNFSTHSISASGESKLYLTPSAVNVEPGKRFDISVIANSPSAYNSAQIDIKYNPESLNLIKATPGEGLPSIANNEHNPDKGLINFTLYKVGGTSGSADLLNMTFEGLAGTSSIALLDSSVIVDNGAALVSGGLSATVTVTNSSTSDSDNPNESAGETNTDNTSTTTQDITTSTDNDSVVDSNNESDSVSNPTTPVPTTDPAVENTSSNESNPSTPSGNIDSLASQENLNSSANTNQTESSDTEKSSIADELPNTGINNTVALAFVVSLIGYCINVLRIKLI